MTTFRRSLEPDSLAFVPPGSHIIINGKTQRLKVILHLINRNCCNCKVRLPATVEMFGELHKRDLYQGLFKAVSSSGSNNDGTVAKERQMSVRNKPMPVKALTVQYPRKVSLFALLYSNLEIHIWWNFLVCSGTRILIQFANWCDTRLPPPMLQDWPYFV